MDCSKQDCNQFWKINLFIKVNDENEKKMIVSHSSPVLFKFNNYTNNGSKNSTAGMVMLF